MHWKDIHLEVEINTGVSEPSLSYVTEGSGNTALDGFTADDFSSARCL